MACLRRPFRSRPAGQRAGWMGVRRRLLRGLSVAVWGQLGVRISSCPAEERPPFWYRDWLASETRLGPTPEEARPEFVDLAIDEPLGSILDSLVYGQDGLAWWGEAPLPPGAAHPLSSEPGTSLQARPMELS